MGAEESGVKRCNTCKDVKALTEFYAHKRHRDGLRYECKPCSKTQATAWTEANRNRFNANAVRARGKRRAHFAAEARAYYAANKESCLAAAKAYRKKNPDKVRKHMLRRQWRELNAPGGPFDAEREDYKQRVEFYGGLCAYCKKAPHAEFDHAIPLSRGGSNHAYNIFPSCRSCNRGVGGKHYKILWEEWEPPCKDGWG